MTLRYTAKFLLIVTNVRYYSNNAAMQKALSPIFRRDRGRSKSLFLADRIAALTSGPLWGSACVYHGLVGSAWLVADLWGSPQGI